MTARRMGRLAAAAAAAGWLILAADPALAARTGPASTGSAAGSAILSITTVPVVPAARISLDGVTHLTDAAGALTLSTSPGPHLIQVAPPGSLPAGTGMRFNRWLDGLALTRRAISLHPGLNLEEAGFQVSHPIRVRFASQGGQPVPLSAITKITMASSVGERFTFAPGSPPALLAANRIVRDHFGLHVLPIRYSVRDVYYNGANVVYGGSQSFYVHPHRTWVVKLLLFSMHIAVRDAFFHFPIGTAVRIRMSNGNSSVVRLGSGYAVTLPDMPRATYELVAQGPGFGLSSPATLTRPLKAKLLLLSWVDIAAVGTFAVLFLIGLPVLGGRVVWHKDRARRLTWHAGRTEVTEGGAARAGAAKASGTRHGAVALEPLAWVGEPADIEPADIETAVIGSLEDTQDLGAVP
jgi:hypothetical protein